MICKKCANIFSDDLTVCPDCDTPVKTVGAENKEEITEKEEIEKAVSLALSEREEMVFEDISSYGQEEPQEEEELSYQDEEPEAEKTEEPDGEEKKEAVQPVRKEKVKLQKMSRKEKGAVDFILSLMVVLIIGMVALTGISLTTEVFEKDEDSVKAIALSGLSAADTKDLEDYLSKIAIVAYDGYDREKDVIVDVMAYLRPHDAGGLYSKFYGSAELVTNKQDPNARFGNENGDYSFYVLDCDKADEILASFGFSVNHNVNEMNFYCYEDKYYFANLSDYSFSSSVVADVSSSKRIQDGSYYVECSFYDEKAGENDNSYLETGIILDKIQDTQTGEIQWVVSRISHEPIFDISGMMIKDESGRNDLSYIIETKTVEAVTEDGQVYARYIIEYPYFKGETEGEKAVNSLFAETVKTYESYCENADKDYKKFIKKGGDKEELPYVTYVVARVTYNRNGYISIVEGISESKPQSDYKNTVGEGEEPIAVLPERTIEGYIFDVQTGEFLSKKEVIEADYQLVQEILYRIYCGYGYDDLINEDAEKSEDIPEDEDGVGKTLYEAASALSENGYVFCYVHPKGYTESVVIPYTIDNFFDEDFGKVTSSSDEK